MYPQALAVFSVTQLENPAGERVIRPPRHQPIEVRHLVDARRLEIGDVLKAAIDCIYFRHAGEWDLQLPGPSGFQADGILVERLPRAGNDVAVAKLHGLPEGIIVL